MLLEVKNYICRIDYVKEKKMRTYEK